MVNIDDLSPEERREIIDELLSKSDANLPQLLRSKDLVNHTGSDLVATTPEEGIEQYLEARELEITDTTLTHYEHKLSVFKIFLDEQGINDLREVSAQVFPEYLQWRRENVRTDGDISLKTLRDDLYLFRDFIWFMEDMNIVEDGVGDSIRIPDPPSRSVTKEDIIESERIAEILDHLRTYEYATAKHVALEILAASGCRLGALHSLDVDDFHEGDGAHLDFNHRPPETRLKNGKNGERSVAIPDDLADAIEDYIEKHRPAVTDDAGREPLLASEHGRLAKSTIRRYVYSVTRPCEITGDCPHGRDPATCEAANNPDKMAECPSVQSPHAIRRGYVTGELSSGVPRRVLGDRVDMSAEVMEEYYDARDADEKRDLREDIFDQVHDEEDGYYA